MNRATIIGRLGKDPESRQTSSGTMIVSLSVATSEKWKDKNTGEQKEETEWHRVTAFGRLAEIMSQYLSKGSQVYIEGRIKTEKWQDKDGNDRYTTKIIASQLEMLGGGQQNGGGGGGQQQAQQQSKPQQSQQGAVGAPSIDFSDDIPFSY